MNFRTLDVQEMEKIIGGLTRTNRNTGCMAMGFAAGIAAGFNPFVGGLTTFGCMLLTPAD
ncbi:Blp family class II bacteriocin [Danxiaibacter flavus]|uniref:Blp family class II bacteriocin n=1 Tax=Danxiaibacter flavus TaxID=3049108 RepID=A0ABV3ZH47_9BACT|nr:Blp family class II bacteriocin [Chitinophagaceae bacterium DXS]